MEVGTSSTGEGVSMREINHATSSIGGIGGEMAVSGVVGTTVRFVGAFFIMGIQQNGRSCSMAS